MVTTQRHGTYGLDQFIQDLAAAAREESEPARIVARVEERLRQLLTTPNFLTEEMKTVDPRGESHRTSLYKAADGTLSVLAVVFPEGKPTPVHDHLTWGMVGVYEGRERETKYRRVDDGSREGYAELVEESTAEYNVGEVTSFFPPNDIHQVGAVSPHRSVSIHVYGTDIEDLDRHKFDLQSGRILPWSTRPQR